MPCRIRSYPADAGEQDIGSVSSCGVVLLQQRLVSLDLDGSMFKLHFGLQSRLQRFSRLQGGGQKKAVLEKQQHIGSASYCVLAQPQLHIQAEHMSVSEAPCVPVDPWPDGKQADLTLAQENVGY